MPAILVKTTTSDGMRLDGAMQPAEPGAAQPAAVDAVLCLHGVGGNFYSSTVLEAITPPLVEAGLTVLRANTRGHDGLSTAMTTSGRRLQGAAYEVVDECRYDINAWVDFLVQRGFSRLGLLGHSLGAIKAVYSQAHEPHPAIQRLIALSPPCLSYSWFLNSAQDGPAFSETMTQAQEHVKQGRPDALLQVKFPFPIVIAAGCYIEKYGPDERYNILKFAHRLPCPALFVFGRVELEHGGIAFAGLPEAIAALPQPGRQLDLATIPGADHLYTGVGGPLADEVVRWLQS